MREKRGMKRSLLPDSPNYEALLRFICLFAVQDHVHAGHHVLYTEIRRWTFRAREDSEQEDTEGV